MKRAVHATINGEPTDFLVDTRQTLLDALRNTLNLTGTKEGCSNGNCGACAVIVDGRACDSCLVMACEVEGAEVTTIEGLAHAGQLTPLQRAFVEIGGLECGFCTPGVIMSATALLKDHPDPSEEFLRTQMAGNLCRCTGYDKIVKAIQAVARGEFQEAKA